MMALKKKRKKEKGSQFVEVVRKQYVASVKCKHLVSAGCTKKKKNKKQLNVYLSGDALFFLFSLFFFEVIFFSDA